jgi:hypothetical protein
MTQVVDRTSGGAVSAQLTEDQLQQYEERGYVVPDFRLSKSETDLLYSFLRRLVDENPQWAAHLSSPHVPGSGVRRWKGFGGWEAFYSHPAILDMIEQIIGPDIILWGTSHFYKQPEKGNATPWHRDSFDSPIKPFVSPLVWIAGTESTAANGCLRFIPGTNKDPAPGVHRDIPMQGYAAIELDSAEFDASKAVDCELEAGQMVIFNANTVHGASRNTGTKERASFTLRYMPATSKFEHDAVSQVLRENYHGFHTRPLILVRGVDRAGNDFRRGHPGLDPAVELQKID